MIRKLLSVIRWETEEHQELDDQLMRLLLMARSRKLDCPSLLLAMFERDPVAAALLVRRFVDQNGGEDGDAYCAMLGDRLGELDRQQGGAERWQVLVAAIALQESDLTKHILAELSEDDVTAQTDALLRAIAELTRLPQRLDAFIHLVLEAEATCSHLALAVALEETTCQHDLIQPFPPQLLRLGQILFEKKQLRILRGLSKVIIGFQVLEFPGASYQGVCQMALNSELLADFMYTEFLGRYMLPDGNDEVAPEESHLPLWWQISGNCTSRLRPYVHFIYFCRSIMDHPLEAEELINSFDLPKPDLCLPDERQHLVTLIRSSLSRLINKDPLTVPAYLDKIQDFNLYFDAFGFRRCSFTEKPAKPKNHSKKIYRLLTCGMSLEDVIRIYMSSHLRVELSGSGFAKMVADHMLINQNGEFENRESSKRRAIDLSREFAPYPLYAKFCFQPKSGNYFIDIRNISSQVKSSLLKSWYFQNIQLIHSMTRSTRVTCHLSLFDTYTDSWVVTDLEESYFDPHAITEQALTVLRQIEQEGSCSAERLLEIAELPPRGYQGADNAQQLPLQLLRTLAVLAENVPEQALELLATVNREADRGLNYYSYRDYNSPHVFPGPHDNMRRIREDVAAMWERFAASPLSHSQLVQVYLYTALRILPLHWLLQRCYSPDQRAGEQPVDLALIRQAVPEYELLCKVMQNGTGELFARPSPLGRGKFDYRFAPHFESSADLQPGDVCICRLKSCDFSQGLCWLDGYVQSAPQNRPTQPDLPQAIPPATP